MLHQLHVLNQSFIKNFQSYNFHTLYKDLLADDDGTGMFGGGTDGGDGGEGGTEDGNIYPYVSLEM